MDRYATFLQTYGARLLEGAGVTLHLSIMAALVATSVALVFGLMRLSSLGLVRGTATLYIEFFRGTSLLVQLYWIFYALPAFGVTLDNFTAGFLAVGMNIGAYGAELVRGAIQAVPRGQYEASKALNLSAFTSMTRIIFPQAILMLLPPWTNLMIELLKGTALVSLISVTDLMFQARQINAMTFQSTEAFGTALILYYLIGRLFLASGMRGVETVLNRKLGRAG